MITPSRIVIIFNPKSTGNSPAMARQLAAELREQLPRIPLDMAETARPGHAKNIAYKVTAKYKHALIISVSGDGGYHEVVNGALKAVDQGKGQPILAVAPGGNANDHYRGTARQSLLDAIISGDTERLDVLSVSFKRKKYYAHSYLGLGLTPAIGIELNKHSLSLFKEAWVTLRACWHLQPFEIEIKGQRQILDSLIIANVKTMAKYFRFAPVGSPRDGKFEIIISPHAARALLVANMVRSVVGIKAPVVQARQFTFKTLHETALQLDGEIIIVPASTEVHVKSEAKKLITVL